MKFEINVPDEYLAHFKRGIYSTSESDTAKDLIGFVQRKVGCCHACWKPIGGKNNFGHCNDCYLTETCVECESKVHEVNEFGWCWKCREKTGYRGGLYRLKCWNCVEISDYNVDESDIGIDKYYRVNNDICGIHFYIDLKERVRCGGCGNEITILEKVHIGSCSCKCNLCNPIYPHDESIHEINIDKLDSEREPVIKITGALCIEYPRPKLRGVDFKWVVEKYGEPDTPVEGVLPPTRSIEIKGTRDV